jgi:beta-phosphoglucomutase-like phosphatase (HAD superfamily)
MNMPLTPEAADCLIFDWDGTLVDMQSASYRALAGTLAAFGIELPEPWFAARARLTPEDMIELIFREHDRTLPLPVAEVVRDRNDRLLEHLDQVVEQPRIADIARHHRGRVPLAVASGSSRPVIESTMRVTGLDPLFDVVVCREDVRAGKPAPDLFLLAAERVGIAPARCLVFEDSDEGMLAASRAGMAVVNVRDATPWSGGRQPLSRGDGEREGEYLAGTGAA